MGDTADNRRVGHLTHVFSDCRVGHLTHLFSRSTDGSDDPSYASLAAPPKPRLPTWLLMACVVLVTFLVYLPALDNGFVNWDDHVVLLGNDHYRGFDWPRLRWMFTTRLMCHYQPLTWLTYAVDYKAWGMEPRGYHLTSVLLHIAATGMFFWVARHLLARAIRTAGASGIGLDLSAGLAALFFSVHPLRVESVAWATERRDVVSGLFFMIAVAAYLRASTMDGRTRLKWLAFSLIAYVLSLLGKATAMTLPLVLVAIDMYPLRRLALFDGGRRRADHLTHLFIGSTDGSHDPSCISTRPETNRAVWLEKLPFFAIGIAAAVNAFLGQVYGHAAASIEGVSWLSRVSIACYGTASYLYRTLIPLRLSPLYAPEYPFNPWAWYFLVSGVVCIGISAAVVTVARRWPAGLILWVSYLLLLGPVCGLVTIGPQLAADRYTYLSCLGWALLPAGVWLAVWKRRQSGAGRRFASNCASLIAVAAVGALAMRTRQQLRIWHDTESLWGQAIRVQPTNGLAQTSLANWLHQQGRYAEALEHHRLGVKYRPQVAVGYSDMGVTLSKMGRRVEAIAAYRQALRLDPRCVGAHHGLGLLLITSGNPVEASEGATQLEEALRIEPANARVRLNLATYYIQAGNYRRSAAILRQGLRLSPQDAALAAKLSWLLANHPDAAAEKQGVFPTGKPDTND
jgi:tetratricopeptide (TPR) repeat protein